MAKNNIRSIRFSDELAELIDRQIGDTFTQKFESLIYRAFWELPEKEKQLANIEKDIKKQITTLKNMQKAVHQIAILERDIDMLRTNFENIQKRAEEIAKEMEKAEA